MALKGTTIESVHVDVTAFKHEDTTVDFHINLSNIYGDPVRANSSHTFTAKVANKSGYLADFPCAVDGTDLLIDSDEFFKLAPDNYLMEIWETWTNEDGKEDTAIYPSPSQVLSFTINPNIEDKTGKIIETIDFKATIENTVKDFLKNHPGAGTGQDIDLSDYYKKSDIDRRFATKDSVPTVSLDAEQRTLTINDKTIDIPTSVDLSDYAKKDAVPSIVYDAEKHTLTVGGQEVALPSDVDLSNYYTKGEIDEKISGNKIDLTDYLKASDAEKEFAKKSELPDMSDVAKKADVPTVAINTEKRTITLNGESVSIPDTVDLSGYAKADELPKVELDAENRTITINGKALTVPKEVDLSGYYTKSEVDDKLAKVASGGKVDLTGYLTKSEAGQTYATKAELPDMSKVATKDEIPSIEGLAKEGDLQNYAKKSDIPAVPDLTPFLKAKDADDKFATKSEIPSLKNYVTKEDLPKEPDLSNYATKEEIPKVILDLDKRALTINGANITIPNSVDLSHYYTKDQVDSKITDAVTGGKVDLSGYLTKVDADSSYIAKKSIVLDVAKRELTLDGQSIKIPDSVDLSGYLTKADAEKAYAKKEDIPSIPDMAPYAKKSEIPSITGLVKEAELSSYAKKTDLPVLPDMSQYAKKGDIPSISGLVKEAELAAYAKKTDLPSLDGYAKESDVPKVVLDTAKRIISVNGTSIGIPGNVDLSGYYTKGQVDAAIAAKKIDLTGYLSKNEASQTYATKSNLPRVSIDVAARKVTINGQSLNVPNAVDLSGYLTRTDANAVYATKKELPDMSQYAKNSGVAAVDAKATAAMDKAVSALQKASENVVDYDKLYDGFANKIMSMKF